VRNTCFRSGIADEIYSFCVLEHLDDPYELMEEIVRLLKPQGRAYLRVPNLGTYSSHLDLTHRFLADLRIWRGIMEGYFKSVEVVPEGTKYRDSRLLTLINRVLVRGLRFYELAQGWTFVCEGKRADAVRFYQGWWEERELDR
jgi:SAM-dependent methyltransferase